jgi:hypothetical protein
MEKVSNISSEEELLQLRNEGKISETEYEELRQTLRKTTNIPVEQSAQGKLKPVKTSGLAIASLVFSLVGPIGCIPAVICGHLALRKIQKQAAVGGRGLALAGLIIGYVVLGFSIVLTIPFLLFLGLRAGSYSTESEIAPAELQNAKIEIATNGLKHYSLDSMEGIIEQDKVTIDKQISCDGNGSLRIEATEATAIRIFDTGKMDVENARLICRARLRTENVKGEVYISMECSLPRGEHYSSEATTVPLLTGTTDWTTQETSFLLKKGEKPDNVKLTLIKNGEGTVWIDDVRLLKGPLKY